MASIDGHEYVEIGGIKWATMNIGASTISDPGLYFQWGNTAGYTSGQCGSNSTSYKKPFSWGDYKFCNTTGTTAPGTTGFSKYNSTDKESKPILDECDDMARANWGCNWRMPTTDEFAALGAATDFIDSGGTTISGTNKLTTLSGVTGILVADKNDHSKRLFFPAAGKCQYGSFSDGGSSGRYWSSSLYSSNVQSAIEMYFSNSSVHWQYSINRFVGFSVRGVVDE